MVPVSGPVTYFENCIWRHGVFELGWVLAYFNFMARNTLERKGILAEHKAAFDSYLSNPELPLSPHKIEAYRHLPIMDWADRFRAGAPYFADYLINSKEGAFWSSTDLRPRCRNVIVPAMHIGSWYDAFQYDTPTMYSLMRREAANERARSGQRLVMGPWAHLLPYSVPTSRGTGDIDFGPEARVELLASRASWLGAIFEARDADALGGAPVRISVMGENRWRDENEWPLARTRYTTLWLRSRGHANSLGGNGTLSFEPPSDEPADRFVYDPENPVPTRGGTALGLPPGV